MIGVQRSVFSHEQVGEAWYAKLDCGHLEQLVDVPPDYYPPLRPRGRYMDCSTCTADRDRSQTASATSDPQETT